MSSFGTRSQNNLKGLHPDMVKLMEAAIADTPIDFTITSGVRTTAQQQALYAKGRTDPGDIVTNADGIHTKSNHQVKVDGFGHAVDIQPYINGQIDWEDVHGKQKPLVDYIKSVAAQLDVDITCGIDWTMAVEHIVDPPHIELKQH